MCYRQVLPDTQANSSTPIPLDFPNNVVVVGQGRIPQPRPPSNQKAEKLNGLSGIGSPPFVFSGSEIEPHKPYDSGDDHKHHAIPSSRPLVTSSAKCIALLSPSVREYLGFYGKARGKRFLVAAPRK